MSNTPNMSDPGFPNRPIDRRDALKIGAVGAMAVLCPSLLFGCVNGGTSRASKDGGLLLSFFVVSDIHITDVDDDNGGCFQKMLSDLRMVEERPSAIVVNGDLTNGGGENEYRALIALVKESAGDLSNSFLWVMGNHEQYTGEVENDEDLPSAYEAKYQCFKDAFRLKNTYYDTYVEGYHFIMLAPVNTMQSWGAFNIPDEELQWLDGLLEKDAGTGKPVFVFIHEPLDDTLEDTFEGSWSHGNCVVNPTALRSCLEKYPFAMLFTGHTHAYPHYAMLDGNGPLYAHDGCAKGGRPRRDDGSSTRSGLQVSVYGDRVDIRTRVFNNGTWDEDAQFCFEKAYWV